MPSKGETDNLPQAPWGIISIKAQDEDHETPMQVPLVARIFPLTILTPTQGHLLWQVKSCA